MFRMINIIWSDPLPQFNPWRTNWFYVKIFFNSVHMLWWLEHATFNFNKSSKAMVFGFICCVLYKYNVKYLVQYIKIYNERILCDLIIIRSSIEELIARDDRPRMHSALRCSPAFYCAPPPLQVFKKTEDWWSFIRPIKWSFSSIIFKCLFVFYILLHFLLVFF